LILTETTEVLSRRGSGLEVLQ